MTVSVTDISKVLSREELNDYLAREAAEAHASVVAVVRGAIAAGQIDDSTFCQAYFAQRHEWESSMGRAFSDGSPEGVARAVSEIAKLDAIRNAVLADKAS